MMKKISTVRMMSGVVLLPLLLLPAALAAPGKYAQFERLNSNNNINNALKNNNTHNNNHVIKYIGYDDGASGNAFRNNDGVNNFNNVNNNALINNEPTMLDTMMDGLPFRLGTSPATRLSRDRRGGSNQGPDEEQQAPLAPPSEQQQQIAALAASASSSGGEEEARIVGGSEVSEGQFPFQVSVQVMELSDSVHICGGVILSVDYVLTAAQCITSQVRTNLRVVAGEQQLSVVSPYEQEREVLAITVHPDYDEANVRNDLALIRLLNPFSFGFGVASIPIALEEAAPATECKTFGWGKTSEGGEYSDVLKELTVRTINDGDCENYYSPGDIVYESMICAGDLGGGSDFCQGDQGGPLVCNNYLHGVASWGYGCGRGYPGVYTQVIHFKEWITEEISEDGGA